VAIETLAYTVVDRFDGVEIRQYDGYVVAETEVEGDRSGATNEGFRRLAGYIFGGNRGDRKIAMTAPVLQAKGQRIAMTAPVLQQATGGADASADAGPWLIQFTMPAAYALDALPEPIDARVRLRAEPARRVAALRYSGGWSTRRYELKLRQLYDALARRGVAVAGAPVWARYNPPITPWFLRRNEILVDVAP
jgi:hypothetical protein